MLASSTAKAGRRNHLLLVLGMVILGLVITAYLAKAASTAAFVVSKTADTNDGMCNVDCSLREAIVAANANPGIDKITLPAGTFTLALAGVDEDDSAMGDLDISDDLTIEGSDRTATTVDGGGIDRVFQIRAGANVTITGVTIQNGNTSTSAIDVGGGIWIEIGSSLAISDSVVSDNRTPSGGSGGGINNNGDLTLMKSTVSGNIATNGGGIANSGFMNIVGSTVKNNNFISAPPLVLGGAGIMNFGTGVIVSSTINENSGSTAISNRDTLTLTNSTVSENSPGGGVYSVGYSSGGNCITATLHLNFATVTKNVAQYSSAGVANITCSQVNVYSSIVAGNIDAASGLVSDCSGTITSLGYNLVGSNARCSLVPVAGDQVGDDSYPIDPLLGPLQDNGGPTFTHAPLSVSSVIDAGGSALCPLTDQRGQSRPFDGDSDGTATCDIGAVEYIGPPSEQVHLPLVVVPSSLVKLTDHPGSDDDPDWSPDGSKIAFNSDRTGNREIFVMNSDGTNLVRLTYHPAWDNQPSWSPDGTRIAYESNRAGNLDVFVMNTDGSTVTNLTNHPAVDEDASWSPDGSKIAFTSDRDGNRDIYVMNVGGTGLMNLTNHPSVDELPRWSPDGSKIAFTSNRDGDSDIWVMAADGSNLMNLSDTPYWDGDGIWSPDGARLAFASFRDGNVEIYIMNADGSAPVNVTNHPAPDNRSSWSPLGTMIAFASERDGNSEVYVIGVPNP